LPTRFISSLVIVGVYLVIYSPIFLYWFAGMPKVKNAGISPLGENLNYMNRRVGLRTEFLGNPGNENCVERKYAVISGILLGIWVIRVNLYFLLESYQEYFLKEYDCLMVSYRKIFLTGRPRMMVSVLLANW
jgi:hypothetical protein